MTHVSRRVAVLAAASVAALSLTACGSDSLDTASKSASSGASAASSAADSAAGAADAELEKLVPAAIKSKGTLKVGTDASYAPNEFMGDDGKTPQGMDIDLLNAALAKLGLKATYQNGDFSSLILGVNGGKYDMSISSFTINDERKKEVNMVSYFNAGTQWAVPKGNPKKVDIENACGLNIGVQKGTVQIDDLNKRSKKCTDAGKPPIKQLVDGDQAKITAALVSGKADAMLADSPVGLYAVQQTGGKLEALGDIYEAAPYGVVLKKTDTQFAEALAKAFQAIDKSGEYKKALAKWNNETGAVTDFSVNP
ncbi:MAG: ABC transporter substrate-binding protein [Micrococcales bacterium]|nr:ABC transporter substrate-binding protein [Micrococcales bacterium]